MNLLFLKPENLLGNVGVAESYATFKPGEQGNFSTLLAEISFPNNIEISGLGSTLTFQYYNESLKNNYSGYFIFLTYLYWNYEEISKQWFDVYIYFDDNSNIKYSTSEQSYNVWNTYTINLTSYSSKKVAKIKIYSKCNSSLYVDSNSFDGSYREAPANSAYIGKFQIKNTRNQIQYQSNKLEFKVGSNYYSKLEEAECTDLLSETPYNVIATNNMSNIIGNQLSDIPIYADNFSIVISFSETPAETNNAKLLIRYIDKHGDQQLGGFRIILTYFGDIEYELLAPTILSESQDIILDIPDGKYIKNISIIATDTDYLQNVQIGMLRLYNNIPSRVISQFHKYPVLQATAADTIRTRYSLLTIDPIEVSTSGYIMVGRSGAWILPGTNVIRKQKNQPTINDDPALKTGDIWLNLSSEPLIAYVYVNGLWQICSDIPIGYVTLLWSNPTATATVTKINDSHTLTASVNASTFAQQAIYSGSYVFTFNGTNWILSDSIVNMTSYGITVTGTPVEGDIITVNFSVSESTISNIETYPYNQNGYNINTYTANIASISGRDGRDGQNGKDGKNGAPGAQGPAGVGVPTGGTTGQALVKINNANYNTTWTTLATVPSGGTTGQALVKTSDSTGAYAWGTVQSLPIGGTTGQVLAKSSDSNYDVTWTDSLTSSIFNGGTAGQTLIKNSSTNLDFSWGTLEALPSGGNTGQVLAKSSNNDYDASWTTAYYIPSGGTTGQALVKINGDNYNVEWSTLATVPNGGTAGQTLIKNSNTDGDYSWETLEALPEGGTTGQSLVKTSGTDYDVGWETVLGLPSGGSTNYVLSKTSNTDYEVNWRACYEVPDKGLPGQVLTKKTGTDHDISWEYVSQETGADVANINFKTDIYFYASINQYTGVALEQFINMDGIATADQEDVLPYYYIPHKSILNSSEETLVFDLKPINFGGQSLAIYLRTEHTDTVTFSYSTDNGETFTSLSEEVNTPCSTTSLILRITMSAGSEVKNIGLLVK